MILSAQSARQIVDEMKACIHHDINLMDEQGIILASTDPSRIGQYHSGALKILKEGLPLMVIEEDDARTGVRAGVNLPILFNGTVAGVIGITGDPQEVSIFGDVIKKMIEIQMVNTAAQQQTDLIDRARSAFIESWLFGSLSAEDILFRARLLGIETERAFTLALFSCSGNAGDETDEVRTGRVIRYIQSEFSREDCICCAVRSRILLLFHSRGKADAVHVLFPLIQGIADCLDMKAVCGVSMQKKAGTDIHSAYSEARMALSVAGQAGKQPVLFYDDASFDFAVASISDKVRSDLCRTVFSTCTEEEKQQFSELAIRYFRLEGDLGACADSLYIHRNTIQYRLNRMKEKTSFDLRKPKDAFMLYLAACGYTRVE